MLLDANLLLFAVYRGSPFHQTARDWLAEQLNGDRRVGMPWQSLAAFLRLATNSRVFEQPLDPATAWTSVQAWLDSDLVWVPAPGARHRELLGGLIERYQLRGDLIPDALLAATAIEHGLEVCSADTDFARFREVRWLNPLAGA
ncbi:MAG TPA: TA system VapC family ribonuclease toxin [Solirubrobacteraceae bacterium]|nr:TA system VapC family ribonuclease toxin [Solirubrobacteraceae bacterium]